MWRRDALRSTWHRRSESRRGCNRKTATPRLDPSGTSETTRRHHEPRPRQRLRQRRKRLLTRWLPCSAPPSHATPKRFETPRLAPCRAVCQPACSSTFVFRTIFPLNVRLVARQPTGEELRDAGRQGVEFGALLDYQSVFETESRGASSRRLNLPPGGPHSPEPET